jgi:hypothetical protein
MQGMMRRDRVTLAGEFGVIAAVASFLIVVGPAAIRQVESQHIARPAPRASLIQESAQWFYVDPQRWPRGTNAFASATYRDTAAPSADTLGARRP